MKQVALNKLCQIIIGKTPSRSNESYWGEGFKWLSIADMKVKKINSTKEEITDLAVKETKIKLIPKNTVVMSFKLSIGKLGITQENMFTNEAIASFPIIQNDKIIPEYLYYALKTLKLNDLSDRAVMGATLNKAKLNQIEIPLPSLEVQHKIVKTLEKAEEITEKRKAQIDRLSSLTDSVFLQMFGDPNSNMRNHKTLPLKELGNIQTGNTPSRKVKEYYGEYIEWIKSDNINTPSSFLTKSKENLSEKGATKGRVAKSGSILVTCIAGSFDCIGNAAIADRDVAFNQQINAITPYSNLIDTNFLYCQFKVAKKLVQKASTNSMKGMISKSNFGEISFIVPNIESQKKFSNIFLKIEAQKKLLEMSLVQLENNYKILIKDAFKGK